MKFTELFKSDNLKNHDWIMFSSLKNFYSLIILIIMVKLYN